MDIFKQKLIADVFIIFVNLRTAESISIVVFNYTFKNVLLLML